MADNNGNKTGGRKKGTPNKITVEVIELLEQLNCNPVEGLARLALESNCEEMKFKAYKELAQYVAPKRRAIDLRASDSMTHEEKLKELI